MSGESEMSEEEQAPEEQEQQVDSIEERARAMGWRPKEEFNGPDDRWVDAEEFVKRGEENLPIARERNRAMEKQILDLKRQHDDLKKTMKDFAEHHKTVSEREYKRAEENIRKQKAQAVEVGDKNAYLEAEKMETDLRASKPKTIEVPEEQQDSVHPEFPNWVAENKWYESDKALQGAADAIAAEMAKNTVLEGRAFFDAVKERVKQEFPSKFENSRRNQPASVESGGGRPKKGGKTYADLPEEAKRACDKFVEKGLMTKEQYVKEYDWSES